MGEGQIRQVGGGRKTAQQRDPRIEEIFLAVISDHIAGDPMNEAIRWIKLTRAQVSEAMQQRGVSVSRNIVRKLLKQHKLVKRKMQRKRSIGRHVDREEQFNNIIKEKAAFMASDNPIISIDTKKKEQVGGNLYRPGQVYGTQAIEVSDHDYPYLADLKIAPHGIYDIKKNKAYINIGVSAETAEFICDSLKRWWLNYGSNQYPQADTLLIFCDAGGANSYRHHIFKIEMQKLANEINIPIKSIPFKNQGNPILFAIISAKYCCPHALMKVLYSASNKASERHT